VRIAASKKINQSAPPSRTPTMRMEAFDAPTRGWIRNENLAASKGVGADLLDNWFPTATSIKVRGGSTLYATIGSGARVGAIMPYILGATKKLFAANTTAIYDITTPADPVTSPATSVSGLTNGDWAFVQFTTSGGTFLRLVNGADTPRVYDGSTWGTTPAITGVTATTLSHVWAFKNRLFFVQKNTLDAWYLPVDSIGGAAVKFPLGGIFKRGGSLMFGGSWAVDTGSGLGEKCVFISTEGEVAIYEGTDPASAASWALEGVYRIGRPLGQRAVFRAGGDLAIATDVGIVPLSQAISTDLGALGGKAITRTIEDEWAAEVAQRVGLFPWHVEIWPTKQMAIVAMPTYSSLPARCLVANIRTGAWTRYTGWDTQCLGLYQDRMFFGTAAGLIVEAETGGTDQGSSYTAQYVNLYSDCGAPGMPKVVTMMRPLYITTQTIGDKVSCSFDYVPTLPTAPSAAAIAGGANTWDSGLWDTATWSDTATKTVSKNWRAVTGSGISVAPTVQVTVGQTGLPDIELVKTDLQFTVGSTPG
jgi:hypothetical protein